MKATLGSDLSKISRKGFATSGDLGRFKLTVGNLRWFLSNLGNFISLEWYKPKLSKGISMYFKIINKTWNYVYLRHPRTNVDQYSRLTPSIDIPMDIRSRRSTLNRHLINSRSISQFNSSRYKLGLITLLDACLRHHQGTLKALVMPSSPHSYDISSHYVSCLSKY